MRSGIAPAFSMTPIHSPSQVLETVQQAKAGASAYCTNFFPVQAKLQAWIIHQELWSEVQAGAAFFLRKDRHFWHLYFSAANPEALTRALAGMPELKRERLVLDLVGKPEGLAELSQVLEASGFRPYTNLLRLARSSQPVAPTEDTIQVLWADQADGAAILQMLESSFDCYADQLPITYELAEALAGRQIMAIKQGSSLAALLYFETQGLTSNIRYWVVAEEFRSHRYGSALIRQYFMAQTTVRRFLLWVTAKNDNAIQKYRHYGYAPDGLVDQVFVNALIRS
jgi:hypothetical protein